MDLFEKMTQTGRGSQERNQWCARIGRWSGSRQWSHLNRALSIPLGQFCLPVCVMRKALKPLSSLGHQKDYWVIYEFTMGRSCWSLWDRTPFSCKLWFLHLLFSFYESQSWKINHPHRLYPIFQMVKQSQGEKATCPRSGTLLEPWGEVPVFFWLVLELITPYSKQNKTGYDSCWPQQRI